MLRGSLAAVVTPLGDGGAALDEDAVGPYVDFLARPGRLDGILALGTTGEGILLSVDERKRVAERFIEAGRGRLQVAIHAGAQTTADTVDFAAAAEASGPIPFYLYEFKGRAGYSIPLPVVERLGDRVAGLKVSNQPLDAVEPYLLEGLDVFIGAESLVDAGVERGAAGSVSGLAAAFPEGADPSKRVFLERFPFQAALKTVIALRGVPIQEVVRPPLRGLAPEERAEVEQWLESS